MTWTRRDWLQLTGMGLAGHSLSGWLPALAEDSLKTAQRKRSCILLWMPGGPSQTDTFDPKPDHPNGGEFKAIETSVPGIRVTEHLPQLAKQMEHMAVVASMKTKEGDHQRAAYHLRTGYRPSGPVQYPTLGSLVSHELTRSDVDLPGFVSIMPPPAFGRIAVGPGFLGPSRAPLIVGGENSSNRANANQPYGPPLSVPDITLPAHVDLAEADSRLALLNGMDDRFSELRTGQATNSHREAYRQAVQMMRSPAIKAFNLDEEPEALRTRYGKNRFGQACLLARRLVEQGVPFIEIALSGVEGQQAFGWDTHSNNFQTVKSFCNVLDPAWATLVDDLKQRGLLDSTLIVWMGEFGRTPRINGSGGRDHYPNAWSTVLCGGGIRGGQVYGGTSKDGLSAEKNPVSVSELLATVCGAVGIDHRKQNMSNVGRPIRIVEPEAQPIQDLLA
jgi:hypothetical protein